MQQRAAKLALRIVNLISLSQSLVGTQQALSKIERDFFPYRDSLAICNEILKAVSLYTILIIFVILLTCVRIILSGKFLARIRRYCKELPPAPIFNFLNCSTANCFTANCSTANAVYCS
jgi:hypothetical protein